MAKLSCLCNYCGNKFSAFVYNDKDMETLKCIRCGDRSLVVRAEAEKSDVFGYNKSGPMPDAYFRKKKEE